MLKNSKAIIFDMDGVITDTMPYHARAWVKIFHKNGIMASKFEVYKREGERGVDSIAKVAKDFGVVVTKKQCEQMIKEKEDLFKKIVKKRFITGARSLLKFLVAKGVKVALVTGTARNEVKKVLPQHIYQLFDVMITGDDVKKGKPHPEPYLKAIKSLKIKKTEAIVIENAPYGIESANRAGLKCLAIETSLPRKYLKKAFKIFKTHQDLKKYLNFKN